MTDDTFIRAMLTDAARAVLFVALIGALIVVVTGIHHTTKGEK